jgi:hypothetical protein
MLRYYRRFFRDAHPGPLFSLVIVGVWLRFAAVGALIGLRRIAGLVRGCRDA